MDGPVTEASGANDVSDRQKVFQTAINILQGPEIPEGAVLIGTMVLNWSVSTRQPHVVITGPGDSFDRCFVPESVRSIHLDSATVSDGGFGTLTVRDSDGAQVQVTLATEAQLERAGMQGAALVDSVTWMKMSRRLTMDFVRYWCDHAVLPETIADPTNPPRGPRLVMEAERGDWPITRGRPLTKESRKVAGREGSVKDGSVTYGTEPPTSPHGTHGRRAFSRTGTPSVSSSTKDRVSALKRAAGTQAAADFGDKRVPSAQHGSSEDQAVQVPQAPASVDRVQSPSATTHNAQSSVQAGAGTGVYRNTQPTYGTGGGTVSPSASSQSGAVTLYNIEEVIQMRAAQLAQMQIQQLQQGFMLASNGGLMASPAGQPVSWPAGYVQGGVPVVSADAAGYAPVYSSNGMPLTMAGVPVYRPTVQQGTQQPPQQQQWTAGWPGMYNPGS